MAGIPLISSPLSETWVAWVLLFILVLLPIASVFQPQLIRVSFVSLLSRKERDSIFVDSSPDFRARMVLQLYTLLILAMSMMVMFRTSGDFVLEWFGWILLCCFGALVIRWLMQLLVGYVFFTPQTADVFARHYHYLNHATAVALLPITLLAIYLPDLSHSWLIGAYLTAATLYLVLVVYKIVMLLSKSAWSAIYILLYVLTVEVVPIGALVVVVKALV